MSFPSLCCGGRHGGLHLTRCWHGRGQEAPHGAAIGKGSDQTYNILFQEKDRHETWVFSGHGTGLLHIEGSGVKEPEAHSTSSRVERPRLPCDPERSNVADLETGQTLGGPVD